MKNLVLTLLLFAGILESCATAKIDAPTQQTLRELKENGLIVWLPDSRHRIEYFKSRGWDKEAAKEAERTAKRNRELVGYFNAHFNFCKVYFYYTSLEEDLKNGLPVFLNSHLQPDSSIPFPEKKIIGGFYYRDDAEHAPFLTRQFRIENSGIRMKLVSESFFKPWNIKMPYREYDIIRLNKKLTRMASSF